MKKHISILLLTMSASAFAQEGRVGINTTEPKATLDVTASATDLTRTDGFIAPRLKGDELKAKDGLYDSPQTGAIVYATNASSDAGVNGKKTINVTEKGYYYFDGDVWVKFPAKYVEPWNVSDTVDPATSNTQNIYQNGNIGIRSKHPTSALHILNKTGYLSGGDDDIHIESYANDPLQTTGNPIIYTSVARGTQENPENLKFNDFLGSLRFQARYNDQFSDSTSILSAYKGDGTNNLSNMAFVTSGVANMVLDENGNVGIGTVSPTSKLQVVGLQEFADNADALANGLTAGAFYRTGDFLKVVH